MRAAGGDYIRNCTARKGLEVLPALFARSVCPPCLPALLARPAWPLSLPIQSAHSACPPEPTAVATQQANELFHSSLVWVLAAVALNCSTPRRATTCKLARPAVFPLAALWRKVAWCHDGWACCLRPFDFPFLSPSARRTKMDTLGIEPRASRMLSGCDTTTPRALDKWTRRLVCRRCAGAPICFILRPGQGNRARTWARRSCEIPKKKKTKKKTEQRNYDASKGRKTKSHPSGTCNNSEEKAAEKAPTRD